MTTNPNNTTAALINLSTLTQYFIPFGNFIFPIIIWSSKKQDSEYINKQGKNTINFQLSVFLYSLLLVLIAIPIFMLSIFQNINVLEFGNRPEIFFEKFNTGNISELIILAILSVVLIIFIKVAEFYLIIYASLKTPNGDNFKYPLTINFIK